MDQYFRNDNDFKYEHCVLRHTCITGNSSYLYWEKSSGNEPILLMLPLGDTQFLNLEKEQKDKLFGSQFGDGYGYEGWFVSSCDTKNCCKFTVEFIRIRTV